MNESLTVKVAIYTDGLGTFQARCLGCEWRGRWYRSEASAVEQGRLHVDHQPPKGN